MTGLPNVKTAEALKRSMAYLLSIEDGDALDVEIVDYH